MLDSILLAVTVLSQFGSTALLVQHSSWGRGLTERRRLEILAAVTVAYVSFLRFIMNWRSGRQVGDRLSFVGKLFATYSFIGLPVVVRLAFKESYSIEQLWSSALYTIAACCLIDLVRAADLASNFMLVVLLPLSDAIMRTKEHLFWRIGFLIMSLALIAVMLCREGYFADLKKAEDRRRKEAGEVNKSRLG